MEKREIIIAMAILLIVGSVTVGSIAMDSNNDKKHIDKKTELVLETDKDSKDNDNSEEQTDESNTEENNASEEQKEESVTTSSSEEKKETKKESKKEEKEKSKKESKKEEKEKSKKTEEKKSKKEEKKTFSTEVSKPSSKPSPSKPSPSKPTPSKPAPSKPAPSKPNKPSHTHNWVANTKQVHHPAVGHNEKVLVKAAWTEKIPRYKDKVISVCNTCGADITGNTREHFKATHHNGHHTELKPIFSHYEEVYHEAQYTTKWVIDKAAWTETVVTGYHCSCGAKK